MGMRCVLAGGGAGRHAEEVEDQYVQVGEGPCGTDEGLMLTSPPPLRLGMKGGHCVSFLTPRAPTAPQRTGSSHGTEVHGYVNANPGAWVGVWRLAVAWGIARGQEGEIPRSTNCSCLVIFLEGVYPNCSCLVIFFRRVLHW